MSSRGRRGRPVERTVRSEQVDVQMAVVVEGHHVGKDAERVVAEIEDRDHLGCVWLFLQTGHDLDGGHRVIEVFLGDLRRRPFAPRGDHRLHLLLGGQTRFGWLRFERVVCAGSEVGDHVLHPPPRASAGQFPLLVGQRRNEVADLTDEFSRRVHAFLGHVRILSGGESNAELSSPLVRSAVVLSASGVLLGALVAIVAHFASWTVPSTYYVGVARSLGAGEAEANVATPLVHPSWSPLLPIAMVVGLVIGLLAWIVVGRVGLRITAGEHERSDAQRRGA